MLLYHYGQPGYTALKTLESQRTITQKEKQEAKKANEFRRNVPPGFYYQHISFLFDPIKPDHWKHFKRDHPVWRKGVELTEYTVDTKQIGNFKWQIVETPEINDAKYDDTLSEEDFWDLYVRINRAKYLGSGSRSLEQRSREFVGQQTKYLKLAYQLNPDSSRYAADVPHVMLYPEDGMVLFESSRTVKLE